MQVSVVYSWQVSAFWWENTLWYDIDAFETGYPRSRPMIPATFCLTDAELYSRDLSNERLYQMCRVLRDTGFVVIENAIDPELIGRVKLEHDAALDNYMKSRGGLTGLKDKTFGINHVGFFHPSLAPSPLRKLLLTHLLFRSCRQQWATSAVPLSIQILRAQAQAINRFIGIRQHFLESTMPQHPWCMPS